MRRILALSIIFAVLGAGRSLTGDQPAEYEYCGTLYHGSQLADESIIPYQNGTGDLGGKGADESEANSTKWPHPFLMAREINGPPNFEGKLVLRLDWGIGPHWYYPSQRKRFREAFIMNRLNGRKIMAETDEEYDWFQFHITIPDGKNYYFTRSVKIVVDLSDGTQAVSKMILFIDGPTESETYNSLLTPVLIRNGSGAVPRSQKSLSYPIYVAFSRKLGLLDRGKFGVGEWAVDFNKKRRPVNVSILIEDGKGGDTIREVAGESS